MMSDEEKEDDTYIRHPLDYRSDALNNFITKLDARCDKELTHSRGQHTLGSPRKIHIPQRAKKWMIKKQSTSGTSVESIELTTEDISI